MNLNGVQQTIQSKPGSNIDVEVLILVFINDILQVPGDGYEFKGGSFITFKEAPKEGDTSKILFYRGTGSVDVSNVDILETIKKGDEVLSQLLLRRLVLPISRTLPRNFSRTLGSFGAPDSRQARFAAPKKVPDQIKAP